MTVVTINVPTSRRAVKMAIVVVVVAGLLGGAYYWWTGTPQYSVNRLMTAIQSHDKETAFEHVDFDAITEGFIQDAKAEMAKQPKDPDDIFGGAGDAFAQGLLELLRPVVRSYLEQAFSEAIQPTPVGAPTPTETSEFGISTASTSKELESLADRQYTTQRSGDVYTLTFDDGTMLVFSKYPGRIWKLSRLVGISELDEDSSDKLNRINKRSSPATILRAVGL